MVCTGPSLLPGPQPASLVANSVPAGPPCVCATDVSMRTWTKTATDFRHRRGRQRLTVCHSHPPRHACCEVNDKEAATMTDVKRVLVATDFSDASEAALRYGIELARAFKARIHVLHVLEH